jgi:DNA processing protein
MKYLNALNKISGIGPQRIKMLMAFFSEPEQIWKAGLEALRESRIGDKMAEKLFLEKKSINPDFEWEKMQKENIRLITISQPEYPDLLKEIDNPPYILYMKGSLDINACPCVAIVGSRKYTAYGAQIARSFAGDLSRSGLTVVSGMAIGIDSFAHRGALDENEKTIAVLGNSLDDKNIYPRINFNLAREISQSGALISEYSVETKAGELTFPARNRIIAGLTLGTLVVEAGEKSGALITAQMALDYNREVFSVPGSIFSPASTGTNELIKKGAKTVTSVRDILEELDLKQEGLKNKIAPKIPTTKEEDILLKIISADPLHIDNISKLSKLQIATVASLLSVMEIKGWAKNIGGQNYIQL